MGDRLIRLSLKEETELVGTVSSLVQGGIGVVDAYRSAAGMLGGRSAAAAGALVSQLELGAALTAAAKTVLARIEPMHLAMLRVTDQTGDAVRSMSRADRYLQTRLRLRAKTAAAAVYPSCVIGATIAGCLLLILVVIPAAEGLLAAGGTPAHDATRALARRSTHLLVAGAIASGLAAVGALMLVVPRTGSGVHRWIDRARLAIPVTGTMESLVELLAFSNAVAGMLDAGTSLGEALRAAVACTLNSAMRHDVAAVSRLVERGVPVSRAVAQALPRFGYLARWFALGESGADLPEMMGSLTRFIETRLDRLAGRIGTLIEPLLIAVAGSVVLVVVLVVVKPLFELYGDLIP